MNSINIIICGVAQQGVSQAGKIFSLAAANAGYDVKMSASANREKSGRSVSCFVRYGNQVHSPLIRTGQADIILSFERMETLRFLHMAKPGATIIVNDERVDFQSNMDSDLEYVDDIDERIANLSQALHLVSLKDIAGQGATIAEAMLGLCASSNGLPEDAWEAAITNVHPQNSEQYLAAFKAGKEHMSSTTPSMQEQEQTHEPEQDEKGVRTFEEMLELVKALPKRTVAIAGASNEAALHAGIECVELGLGTPIFIGDEEKIKALASEKFPEFDFTPYQIINTKNDLETASTAVSIVREHKADILLKGGVNTPTLMREVLSSKRGLRAGNLLSDTFVFEYPDENGMRLVMITDGGVTLQPTIQQKVEILKNAVIVAHALGNTNPRVAILAASETINPNVSATMDAAVITKMNRTGQIEGCIVDGPIALDVAVSRKAAEIKGTDSPVAGRADILVTHSIDTANALAKSTTYFAGFRLSHIIVGGTAPILIASRSDTADAKLLSVALGSLMAKHFEEKRKGD
jgi:phosphate butyryltransferase